MKIDVAMVEIYGRTFWFVNFTCPVVGMPFDSPGSSTPHVPGRFSHSAPVVRGSVGFVDEHSAAWCACRSIASRLRGGT